MLDVLLIVLYIIFGIVWLLIFAGFIVLLITWGMRTAMSVMMGEDWRWWK